MEITVWTLPPASILDMRSTKSLRASDTLLLQAAEVNKLPYAPQRGIQNLENWLYGEHFGRSFLGSELSLWKATDDIVTIYPQVGIVERAPSFLSKALVAINRFRKRKVRRIWL